MVEIAWTCMGHFLHHLDPEKIIRLKRLHLIFLKNTPRYSREHTCCQSTQLFANGPEDLGSIPGRVVPKTLKMVLDTSLLNTQQYKVRIKGKVEQSRERSSALPYTSVLWLLKREPSSRPRLRSPTLLIYIYIYKNWKELITQFR